MTFRQLRKVYGRAFLISLPTLYLPHTWVIWTAIRWPTGINLMWLSVFPALPGGYVALVIRVACWNLFQEHVPDAVLLLVAICFTLVLIAILTVIGARGKGWQIAAMILGGGYSVVAALGLHAVSRM